VLQSTYRTFQDALFSPNPVVRRLVLAGLLASGLMVITFFIGVVGPLLALATAAAIIGGVLILNDTHWGFVALCGVVFLIPFASLPFSIGFKPTFLDVALGALFFVWIFKLIIGHQEEFIASPIGLLVMLFLLLALFSFALGLTHSPANTFLLRRFLEILIGIALFFVVANTVRSEGEAIWVTRWVMLAGWGAATIAVLFYALPQESTVALLDRMARFDYPGGFGALRFIEDDPNGTMRAIGTSVDPNVLGGMMILTAALMLPQLVSSQPIFPRWFTFVMLATAMAALYLTYSRSALLGLASVMALLAVLKYRKLIPLGIAAGLLLLLLPISQEYVARLLEGFAGEDLATQMRFGEYKDALILIERYPLFGVGFTGTPDMDIYLGVSMLYLIIAENMGVIGLGMFVAVMAGFFIMAWRAWRKGLNVQMEALLLGYAGAIVGALVSGIFDHYWFNMTYPHMTVLFWLYVGMATAVTLITRQPAAEPRTRV
jgi:polysaccharide biosynthesis protein PslJ